MCKQKVKKEIRLNDTEHQNFLIFDQSDKELSNKNYLRKVLRNSFLKILSIKVISPKEVGRANKKEEIDAPLVYL